MEQHFRSFIKKYGIIASVLVFLFITLPQGIQTWISLLSGETGGATVANISWLSWLLLSISILGTSLFIVIIWILRKPTLLDVPLILQRMHDRINTLAKGLIDKGKAYITDDEFTAMVLDYSNITLVKHDLFEQFIQPSTESLNIIKEKAPEISEQMAIFEVQFGLCFEKHKKIISSIKAGDKKYP